MEPVSSVTAFVARYGTSPTDDPVALDILSGLDAEGRLVVAAQAVAPSERHAWLRARGGHDWSEARLRHVEDATFVTLRRALQGRGLLRS